MKTESATPGTSSALVTVTLDEPIKRGDTVIATVQIRKPKAGELRGVSLVDLGNLNVIALQQVLPRITQPTLTAHEISNLDPADLLSLGAEVGYFLVRKADRIMASPTE